MRSLAAGAGATSSSVFGNFVLRPFYLCFAGRFCCSGSYAVRYFGGITNNPSVLQINNAISIRSIYLRVRYLNDGGALLVQPAKQLHDFLRLARVEVSCWLVCQDQLRVAGYGSRHSNELLLTARELIGVKIFFADDLKAIENIGNHGSTLGARYVAIRQRHINVFLDGEVVQQMIALEDKPNVLAVQFCPPL